MGGNRKVETLFSHPVRDAIPVALLAQVLPLAGPLATINVTLIISGIYAEDVNYIRIKHL